MIKDLKEKLIGVSGSASGITSILGSWQICHNVCLGIVAFLGLMGIAVAGMPLLFLTKFALPFWIAAFFLFLVTATLYFKKRCISQNLLLFNSGLLIAGIPFPFLQKFTAGFWTVGGILILTAAFFWLKEKIKNKAVKNGKQI